MTQVIDIFGNLNREIIGFFQHSRNFHRKFGTEISKEENKARPSKFLCDSGKDTIMIHTGI